VFERLLPLSSSSSTKSIFVSHSGCWCRSSGRGCCRLIGSALLRDWRIRWLVVVVVVADHDSTLH
tara:strand:- start:122 stop:316 length:195 start_codon:yes stop_codon:yes gene_type:complete